MTQIVFIWVVKVKEGYENDIVMCDSLIETLPRVCSYDKK